MLVKGGATVLFSEVTEVRDGVHLLAARCRDAAARDKLAAEMKWYDDYLTPHGVDRDANPTPGNKKGGLANIVRRPWAPSPSRAPPPSRRCSLRRRSPISAA